MIFLNLHERTAYQKPCLLNHMLLNLFLHFNPGISSATEQPLVHVPEIHTFEDVINNHITRAHPNHGLLLQCRELLHISVVLCPSESTKLVSSVHFSYAIHPSTSKKSSQFNSLELRLFLVHSLSHQQLHQTYNNKNHKNHS